MMETPDGACTVTSTTPVPAGLVAVMLVAELTVNVAAVDPKSTAVAPVNADPEMVTEVPPEGGPVDGFTPVTIGPFV